MKLYIDYYQSVLEADQPELLKEKGSKFYSYAIPVCNEKEVKLALERIKKEHYAARHWCYAYRLGPKGEEYRVNDDGEPNNSAGQPIYGQLLAFDLTNTLVIVVRYFGGVKLGVGGLISAYKTSSQLILNSSKIEKYPIYRELVVSFDYGAMNAIMRIIKDYDLKILGQNMEARGKIYLGIIPSIYDEVLEKISSNHHLTVQIS